MLTSGPESGWEDSRSSASEARRRLEARREMAHDVPQVLRTGGRKRMEEEAAGGEDPHLMPFHKKKKMFEQMAENIGASSTMAQAELRGDPESMWHDLRKVRKKMRKDRQVQRRSQAQSSHSIFHVDQVQEVNEDTEDDLQALRQLMASNEVYGAEWCDEAQGGEHEREVMKRSDERLMEEKEASQAGKVIAGKLRLEYQWSKLKPDWQAAFREPLLKAVRVYFERQAISGVKEDSIIDPRKVLSSRFVLTNKGEENFQTAVLKARWILGGHKDPQLGQYPTLAPTASLLGHNLLNMLATQHEWIVHYEDVSAAFLQGKPLPEDREVYVRLPGGYPKYVNDYQRATGRRL